MANKNREITIKVTLDGNNAVKGSAKVKASVRGIKDETGKASSGMKGFGLQTVATGAVAALALNKIKDVAVETVKEAYRLATAAQETASKYKTVLGPSVGEANKFLEQSASLMGLNETKARDNLATITAVAQGFGFTGKAAADFSIKAVKLAGDLTSFNNVPIERTQGAITSALSGETEALKSLGIVLRQADVQERALQNTGKSSADALTQQERATASLQLITEKAGVAVGDLTRTQNSTANQARKAAAEFENLKIELSKELLPVFQSVIGSTEGIVSTLLDWIKVPLSKQLKDEQINVNGLVSEITSLNKKSDLRKTLIGQLQNQYPDFLKNLDAEKVTNKQLGDRLKEVNGEYVKKIALQAQSEATSGAREDYNAAFQKQFQADLNYRKKVAALQKKYPSALGGLDITQKDTEQLKNEVTNALDEVYAAAKKKFDQNRGILFGISRAHAVGKDLQSLYFSYKDIGGAQRDLSVAQKELNNQLGLAADVAKKYGATVGEAAGIDQTEQEKLEAKKASIQKVIDAYQKRLDQIPKQSDGAKRLTADLDDEKQQLDKVNDKLEKLKSGTDDAAGGDGGGVKGLTAQMKQLKKAHAALLDQAGDLSKEDHRKALNLQGQINKLQELIAQRKKYNAVQNAPIEEPDDKSPESGPIDTTNQLAITDPIVDKLNKRMVAQQSYTDLYAQLSEQRKLLQQSETTATQQAAEQNIAAIQSEIAQRRLLTQTFQQATNAQIDSLKQYGQYIEQTVKKAVEARIAQAVADQIAKALASAPFPFNVAIAAAAGAAIPLLFNKLIPDFNAGGVLRGPSHAQGGIPIIQGRKVIAEAQGDEAIINTRSTKLFYHELSSINEAGGGARFPGARTVKMPASFAGGGVLNGASMGEHYAGRAMQNKDIVAAIREGLQGAIVEARVAISEIDEKLGDYRKDQKRIGN